MAEQKYRVLVDITMVVVAMLLIAAGIYVMRVSRVGVMDTERVAQETGVGNRIRDGERRWMNAAYSHINELTERANATIAALEVELKQAADETAKKAVAEKLKLVRVDMQAEADRSRQEFQKYRDGVRRQVRASLDPLVCKIAREHRYDMVIDTAGGQAIPYARTTVDITDEVIKEARGAMTSGDFGISMLPAVAPAPMPSSPGTATPQVR